MIYYRLYGNFVMYSLLPTFSQEDNGSADEDWSKKGQKPLDTTICTVFELSISKNLTQMLWSNFTGDLKT